MLPIQQELEARWLLYQNSDPEIFNLIDQWKVNFYCGFDPTAQSLHLWNFIGFMFAVHLMRRGNKYMALTWGATGMIWDPSGKDSERSFLSLDDLEANEKSITNQLSHVLKNLEKFTWESFHFDFVNNKSFYEWLGYLDFLRDIGKYITVNVMISKDNVKRRIDDPKQSISYTEFSYMLLQWYDYTKLFSEYGVNLQIGGQDQWGNLVTGTELIHKKYEKSAYSLTWPLITDGNGKKFWKSEWNALFLDKSITSPYQLYQYFMNTADSDIERFLKMLTLIELDKIDTIIAKHMENPQYREWQKYLAFAVVEIIHSCYDAQLAEKISNLLFWNTDKCKIIADLSDDEIQAFYKELWWCVYEWENLFSTLVKVGLAQSNSDARQSVQSGAIFIQEQAVSDFQFDIASVYENKSVILVRKWKKNFRLLINKNTKE